MGTGFSNNLVSQSLQDALQQQVASNGIGGSLNVPPNYGQIQVGGGVASPYWGGGGAGGNQQIGQWSGNGTVAINPNDVWGGGSWSNGRNERTLPPETIPDWMVTYEEEEDVNMRQTIFTFRASKFMAQSEDEPNIPRIVTTKITASMEMLMRGAKEEIMKRGIRELEEEILDWKLKNDEYCLTLRRVLELGI